MHLEDLLYWFYLVNCSIERGLEEEHLPGFT